MREFPRSVEALEEALSNPSDELIQMFRRLQGDVLFLGVGGKMGPTMARMAVKAAQQSGTDRRIIGVSRFSDKGLIQRMESWGIECVRSDLLDPQSVKALPDVAAVVYLVGFKFGASQNPARSWTINCSVPTMIAQRYPDVPIAALSTGNVYGMTDCSSEGSMESDPLAPDGEYAMAALGRERVFQFYREEYESPICRLRLNYATELRYGVLIDIAQQVHASEPVDVRTSHVNVIWMRDANDMILRSLEHCHEHPVFNVAGPKLSVSHATRIIADKMNKSALFDGDEGESALLSDGRSAYAYLGTPQTDVNQMLEWSARWVQEGLPLLGRPTKFQVRDGQF